MNKKFITSLNGLRFYLFLLILATHYKYIIAETPIGKTLFSTLNQVGIFAVLFFFILSGFCIALGYSEKFETVNRTNIIDFLKKRMKKIYPLYIITGLIMLLLFYLPINFNWLYAFIFLYIPMLAPFTKWPDGGGNGAGWFIAALFFCYALTPSLIKFLRKRNLLKFLCITYICIVFVALIPYIIPYLHNFSGYKFPPVRLLQYISGLILGIMYVTNSYNLQNNVMVKKHPYLSECIVIFLLLAVSCFIKGDTLNTILGLPLISVTIIYLCNINNGLLHKLFTGKISQYLGNISFECYMIHYPLCILLADKIKPYCSSMGNIIIFYLFLLIATLLISILYKYVTEKCFEKFKKLY